MRAPLDRLLLLTAFVFLGCAAPPRSLFIQMRNPKTNMTLNCVAREAPGQDNEMLYNAVEACARQLESRGFVRVNDATVPPAINQANP
jgi:hypothetical protein